MFGWFKKGKSKDVSDAISQESRIFTASSARKATDLSSMQAALSSAAKAKKDLEEVQEVIKYEALKGKAQCRVLLIIPDYEEELIRQSPIANIEVQKRLQYRVEDLGNAQSYITKELQRAGYQVVIRSLSLQIRRVQGDQGTFFIGQDLLISW